jgi:hypothetical protein
VCWVWAARIPADAHPSLVLIAATNPGTHHPQGPHQHTRELFSLHVVWDELGRFFARFDPFGHKKHPQPCDDKDKADKAHQAEQAHDDEDSKGSTTITHEPAMEDSTFLAANDTTTGAATTGASANAIDATPVVNTSSSATATTDIATPTADVLEPGATPADGTLLRGRHRRMLADDAAAAPMVGESVERCSALLYHHRLSD